MCGKNYDWMVADGLVIINKRGVVKKAMQPVDRPSEPLAWTSRYGSVTFNQYGRELPMGGMNEAGLVVETMLLDETQYPPPDSRPALISLQWVQYLLDNFSTVEAVISSLDRITVRASSGPGIHFLVCDKSGNGAAIEFVGGKPVWHTGKRMPVITLTNSLYADSVDFWRTGGAPSFDRYDSIGRFIRAADMVKNHDAKTSLSAVDSSFDILKHTSQALTQWSIVYDTGNLSIHFRTARHPEIRWLDLRRFDFSCAKPVRVLDVNSKPAGDVGGQFLDYTQQINRRLVEQAFKNTYFLRDTPVERLERLWRYPDTTVCGQ